MCLCFYWPVKKGLTGQSVKNIWPVNDRLTSHKFSALHITDKTIYPKYLIIKDDSHMSECWPYNWFDHISYDQLTDIYNKC